MNTNGTPNPIPNPMDRAKAIAQTLARRGLSKDMTNDLIGLVYHALCETEAEARRCERQALTAEWLTEVLPGEVIRLAAEKVTGKGY